MLALSLGALVSSCCAGVHSHILFLCCAVCLPQDDLLSTGVDVRIGLRNGSILIVLFSLGRVLAVCL